MLCHCCFVDTYWTHFSFRGIGRKSASFFFLSCGGIHPGRVEPAPQKKNHGNTSWSPVPASLHLLALQVKPCLSALRAPEHPLFTPSLLVLMQVT